MHFSYSKRFHFFVRQAMNSVKHFKKQEGIKITNTVDVKEFFPTNKSTEKRNLELPFRYHVNRKICIHFSLIKVNKKQSSFRNG